LNFLPEIVILSISTTQDFLNSGKLSQIRNSIFYGEEMFTSLSGLISSGKYSSFFFIYDENSFKFCRKKIDSEMSYLQPARHLVVPSGESSKSLHSVANITSKMLEAGADRNSLIINVGGGVVCDLGAFCASVFKRGIDYINIPTSLMAMVDAAIGGKTAVNLNDFKNQIGTFHFPLAVGIHLDFLKTLPADELHSGFAEVVKYALLFDAELWEQLQIMLNTQRIDITTELIDKCVSFKLKIVEKDPFEKGDRKLLNAGHTVGHALESFSFQKNSPISHGKAVAQGLVIESFLAKEMKMLSSDHYQQIEQSISNFYGDIAIEEADIPVLIEFLLADKKNRNNNIAFTLIKAPAIAEKDILIDKDLVNKLLVKFSHEENQN